jgi:hypothetical protein
MGERTDSVKEALGELGAELDYQLAKNDWTKEPVWKKPLRRDTRVAIAIAAVIAVSMVVAAATLFTHTFPSGVTGARLTTTCSTLTMGTPSAVVGPGTVRFNCGASSPAFASDGSGAVTPTFTLTGLYTQLSIVSSGAIGTACSGGTVLATGTSVTPAAGNYDYCASYLGSGALTGFTLTWSQ